MISVLVQAPAPIDAASSKHPSAAAGLIDRGIGVVGRAGSRRQRRPGQKSVGARDRIGRWVRAERTVALIADKSGYLVTVLEAGPRIDPAPAVDDSVWNMRLAASELGRV